MPTFRKAVISPGTYQTPEGTSVVDAPRIKRWVQQFKEMTKKGIRPPISWGHAKEALPSDKPIDDEWWRSKFNAGYVSDLQIDKKTGELVLVGTAPGIEVKEGNLVSQAKLEDGTPVTTAIGEVSLGAKNWTDGQGQVWPDSLVHVALTPLPVDHGRNGFEPAGDVQHFSLLGLLTRFATEPPEPMKKPPQAAKPEGGKPEGQKTTPETDPNAVPDDNHDDGNGQPPIGDVLQALATVGLPLPEGTTDDNLKERIVVACKVKESLESGPSLNGPSGAPNAPPVVESTPGTYMSTLTNHADPLVRALASKVGTDDAAKRLVRIKNLAKRCHPGTQVPCLSPLIVKELETEASRVSFSLAADGSTVAHPIDEKLTLLEKTLPPEKFTRFGTTSTEEPTPEGDMEAAKTAAVAYMASVASGKGGKDKDGKNLFPGRRK